MRGELRLKEAVDRLVKEYLPNLSYLDFPAIKSVKEGMHPFGVLVAIILSQNTSDRNSGVALENLKRALCRDLRPECFHGVSEVALVALIKPSGMQRLKAKTILNALREFGSGDALLTEDPETLRRKLLSVAGIGPKTADVFLLFVRKYPTFPMDTHIRRFLYRFGIGERGEDYESLRRRVLSALPPDPRYLAAAHLSIIAHGRRVCRSRRPRCSVCVVRDLCSRRVGASDVADT